jgi:hypothetical protein
MSKYELTFRRTKGSPVTSDEIDNNFKKIKTGHDGHEKRIYDLENSEQDFVTNPQLDNEVERLDGEVTRLDSEVTRLDGRIDEIGDNNYGDDDVQLYLTANDYVNQDWVYTEFDDLLTPEERTEHFNTRFESKSTDDLAEGETNRYYTNDRADARVDLQTGANLDLSSKDTDDLAEGTTHLYFTDARVDARVSDFVEAGSNISLVYNEETGKLTISATGALGYDLSNNTTSDLKEGTNEYYTVDKVQTVIDTNTAGFITDYTVTETDVTQHQASLSITESQISDLKDYLVTESLEYIDDKLQDHEDRITVLEGNPVAPPIPYITVSALSSTADETVNRTITFIVNARNFKDTDNINYNISGTNITASDIATPLSGTIRTGNGQTAFNVEVVRDRTTESPPATETLVFNVTSDSTNEFFSSPDPVNVTILDSSFDSIFKTVGYVSGDWFTYIKNNVSSQWITNFDISSARLDNSDKVTLTQQVNNTISRGGLTSLGLTNADIDTYISLLLDGFIVGHNAGLDVSFPPGTDTVIYKDYKLSITGNDIGLRITGNDTLHPDLNLPHINNIETEGQVKVYVRGDRTHSGVEYTQTYTTTERQTLIDTMINAYPLWDSYPSSLQNFLLDIIDVCIDYTATLPITIDLYNYEILRQNP